MEFGTSRGQTKRCFNEAPEEEKDVVSPSRSKSFDNRSDWRMVNGTPCSVETRSVTATGGRFCVAHRGLIEADIRTVADVAHCSQSVSRQRCFGIGVDCRIARHGCRRKAVSPFRHSADRQHHRVSDWQRPVMQRHHLVIASDDNSWP